MKHPRSGRRWFSALAALGAVLVLGLAGCTPEVLKNEAPAISTYVLDAGIDPRPKAGTGRGVLVVALPNAQPGFDTQYIAYTREPLAIDYYTKSQWADTPARMLLPLVVRAMEASGLFRAVVVPPTPASGDLRLEVDIIRLQHEFYDKPSQVRLTVRAKLFDVATSHVLATQLFEAMVPASSEDAYGGVQAANQAVRRILGELVDFVAASRSAARR